jgi:hypothetical protein
MYAFFQRIVLNVIGATVGDDNRKIISREVSGSKFWEIKAFSMFRKERCQKISV